MVRRFVAILAGLAMAHLTFVSEDFACAKHTGDAVSAHHAMAHREHRAATNVAHAGNDDAPCRTPLVPMCCQALTRCTVAVAIVESQSVHQLPQSDDSVSVSVREIPPSEIIAPDPPPPRA